jgi:hypothetical protein
MPKSHVYVQAKRLKKFGHKAFAYFRDLLEYEHKEFLKYSRKLVPGHYLPQFKKEIEEYHYDILAEEPDTNPNTRIRVIENIKPNQPQKKNVPAKEIIIEITGLNYLLEDKAFIEERKIQEARAKQDQERRNAIFDDSDSNQLEIDSVKQENSD